MSGIILNEFINNCNIVDSSDESGENGAIYQLIKAGPHIDGIRSNVNRVFDINKMAFMEIIDGFRTFQIHIDKNVADIITDIRVTTPNCRITTINGSSVMLNISTISLVSCVYSDIQFRVYVEKDVNRVNVTYTSIILNDHKRKLLMLNPVYMGNNYIASNGVLHKKQYNSISSDFKNLSP